MNDPLRAAFADLVPHLVPSSGSAADNHAAAENINRYVHVSAVIWELVCGGDKALAGLQVCASHCKSSWTAASKYNFGHHRTQAKRICG